MPQLSCFPASSSKRPQSQSPLRAFVSRRYSINIIIIILLIQTIISLPLFLPWNHHPALPWIGSHHRAFARGNGGLRHAFI